MPSTRVTIDAIAAGGDGVGRADGLVVFVPRTAPGDEADVAMQAAGRFARGRLLTLHRASPQRTTQRCHHYTADDCGGCQLQHLTYEAQLAAKRTIVADALERIARRPAPAGELAIEPSPLPWEYRTKLTLAVRDAGGARLMGLRRYDDPDAVFDLTECPITDAAVVAAFGEVRGALDLLPSARTLSAVVRNDDGALVFVLNGGASWPRAREFAERCPSLAVVRWHPHGGGARVILDRRSAGASGNAPIASFQQVNPAVAERLHREVVARALSYEPRTAVDAYAGSGDTAAALHDAGVRMTAIELDAEAAAFSAQRLAAPSRAIMARVEDALGAALPADVVIVNPPRSGVAREVTDALRESPSPPRGLLYVSCNPATLARDLGRLPNFRVASVRAYDMFPQTAHVETLCELTREPA